MMNRIIFLTTFFCVIGISAIAQLDTEVFAPAKMWDADYSMFFTNRILKKNDDGTITFKNHTTKQTKTLYFCRYDFDKDSIELNYKVVNLSEQYPTSKIEHNIFYDFYNHQRLERGIKNFYFIVGGYGKTFNKQIKSYVKRLKSNYGDTLFKDAAIIVFAWGDEDQAYRYYNGVRASKRGASDFAIYQHMLDEFVSDTEFFKTNPNDLTMTILFSSMGNYLFKEYLEERQKQNIPLVKVYHRISFMGSVASRKSFKKGNAFYNLDQMTDSVDVYVNHKDALLLTSGILHLSGRLGRKGPRRPDLLDEYINIINIDDLITLRDLYKGLGHDYLLTNPVIHDQIINDIHQNIDDKEK